MSSVGEYFKILDGFIEYFGKKFNRKTNVEVYDEYLKYCEESEHANKIAFSRYVVKNSNYKIVNKTIRGKKYRIFTKK